MMERNGSLSTTKEKKNMIEITWKFQNSIAVTGDQHIGDRYAIWPPNFYTLEGNSIGQNPAQMILWKYWEEFCNKCDEFQVQEVWDTADIMHGQNHREEGMGTMTTNMREQKIAAAMVLARLTCSKNYDPSVFRLKPLTPEDLQNKKPAEIITMWMKLEKERNQNIKQFLANNRVRTIKSVAGSGYHQGASSGQFPEQSVVEDMLGGEYWGPIAKVERSGRVFLIMHGGGGAFMYPETQAGRELLTLAEWESIEEDYGHVDCIICGHLHNAPMHLEKYGQHFIRTGCWQIWSGNKFGFNPYGRKQPKCNAGILLIDDHSRIRYIPFDFKPMPRLWDYKREEAELTERDMEFVSTSKETSDIDASMGGEE